jgi:hypothetical protein
MMAVTVAGGRNQSPSNWPGTGPPAGEPGVADGVSTFAEEVDWPHAEARMINATPDSTKLARDTDRRGLGIRASAHEARSWQSRPWYLDTGRVGFDQWSSPSDVMCTNCAYYP